MKRIAWPIAWLGLLLILPVWALSRLVATVSGPVLAGAATALSLFTFLAYRSDKHRAEAGQQRIPESTLHLAELLGGWPGAFLGQHAFRHKTAKISFQFVFWGIVLLHELVALDSLLGWRLAHAAWRAVHS